MLFLELADEVSLLLVVLPFPFFFLPGLDFKHVDFNTANIVLVEGVFDDVINGMLTISFTAALVVTLGVNDSCFLACSSCDEDIVEDVEFFFDFFFFQNLSTFKFLYFTPNMGFSSQKEKGFFTTSDMVPSFEVSFEAAGEFASGCVLSFSLILVAIGSASFAKDATDAEGSSDASDAKRKRKKV